MPVIRRTSRTPKYGKRKPRTLRKVGKYAKYKARKVMKAKRMHYTTQAGTFTNSMFKFSLNRPSGLVKYGRRVGAPNIKTLTSGGRLDPIVGHQRWYDIQNLNNTVLNDILNVVGNQSAPNRMIAESLISDLTLTNVSNSCAEVEIYDIVPRRDIPTSNSWSLSAGAYVVNSTVEEYISAGVDAGASVTPGTGLYERVGVSAFDSQFFKDYFKVLRRTHVMLNSGASHRHQQMIKVNKLVDQAVGGAGTIQCAKGASYYTLINVKGCNAIDTTGLSPPNGVTNVANPLVLWTCSRRLKYTWTADVTSNLAYNDPFPANNSSDLLVRNIGSGVLEAPDPL